MSHRTLRYETSDGEERFAVWSTVVDDWLAYDMHERQLREWYFGKQMEQARVEINGRIESLRKDTPQCTSGEPYEMRDKLPDDAGVTDA